MIFPIFLWCSPVSPFISTQTCFHPCKYPVTHNWLHTTWGRLAGRLGPQLLFFFFFFSLIMHKVVVVFTGPGRPSTGGAQGSGGVVGGGVCAEGEYIGWWGTWHVSGEECGTWTTSSLGFCGSWASLEHLHSYGVISCFPTLNLTSHAYRFALPNCMEWFGCIQMQFVSFFSHFGWNCTCHIQKAWPGLLVLLNMNQFTSETDG